MPRVARSNQASSGIALMLTLAYAGLVIYASLYPFTTWHFQGIWPWEFVTAPLPKYWTGFDVTINVLGYIPLGFFMATACKESAKGSSRFCLLNTVLLASLFSFLMEAIQTYSPTRITSNLDWALNTLGALIGVALSQFVQTLGLLRTWRMFREGKFHAGSGLTLGLLLLWPLALLYPTALPLALGQGLGQWLELETQDLSTKARWAVVACGFLVPLCMGYAVTRTLGLRLLVWALLLLAAVGVTTLSNGISFGPSYAMDRLQSPLHWGLWMGCLAGLALIIAKRRLCWVLALAVLLLQLFLLSLLTLDPYVMELLQFWESGQFIRFYGATQWLGRLWPFTALILIILNLIKSEHR